jgi:hypothetical protein
VQQHLAGHRGVLLLLLRLAMRLVCLVRLASCLALRGWLLGELRGLLLRGRRLAGPEWCLNQGQLRPGHLQIAESQMNCKCAAVRPSD